MPADSPQENQKSSTLQWVIIGFCFLLGWALFWSVDPSFKYFLLAGALFSVFKIIQNRRFENEEEEVRHERHSQSYQSPAGSSFWENVGESFLKQSPESRKKLRGVFMAVIFFVGSMFFIVMVSVLANLDSTDSDSVEYNQRASDFYSNQQYDSAAYYYRLALNIDPGNPQLWLERGNAFLNLPNVDSALVMYQKALELNPTFETAQYNIGYIYFDRRNYGGAIQEGKLILEYSPDYTDAKLLIGDSYYNQTQLDSALTWYDNVYQTGYRSAPLCHLMAYIYDVKGKTSTAINLYQEAMGQDSSIVEIYTRLGELIPGEDGNWYRTKAANMSQAQ
jgi:tetratricopeptide (TPR) repeat protein